MEKNKRKMKGKLSLVAYVDPPNQSFIYSFIYIPMQYSCLHGAIMTKCKLNVNL